MHHYWHIYFGLFHHILPPSGPKFAERFIGNMGFSRLVSMSEGVFFHVPVPLHLKKGV